MTIFIRVIASSKEEYCGHNVLVWVFQFLFGPSYCILYVKKSWEPHLKGYAFGKYYYWKNDEINVWWMEIFNIGIWMIFEIHIQFLQLTVYHTAMLPSAVCKGRVKFYTADTAAF